MPRQSARESEKAARFCEIILFSVAEGAHQSQSSSASAPPLSCDRHDPVGGNSTPSRAFGVVCCPDPSIKEVFAMTSSVNDVGFQPAGEVSPPRMTGGPLRRQQGGDPALRPVRPSGGQGPRGGQGLPGRQPQGHYPKLDYIRGLGAMPSG